MKYYRVKCKCCDSLILNTQTPEMYTGSLIGSHVTKQANPIQAWEENDNLCFNFLSNRLVVIPPDKGAKTINNLVKCNKCETAIGEKQLGKVLLWKSKIIYYPSRFKCHIARQTPSNNFNANVMMEKCNKLLGLMDEYVMSKCASAIIYDDAYSFPFKQEIVNNANK